MQKTDCYPMPSDLSDGRQLAHWFTLELPLVSLWPSDSFFWMLMASRRAMSILHLDAGAFATHLFCLLGFKLWCIKRGQPTLDSTGGLSSAGAEWQYAVLGPGDHL